MSLGRGVGASTEHAAGLPYGGDSKATLVPAARLQEHSDVSAFLLPLWKTLSLIKTAAPLQLMASPQMFADG